MQFSTSSAYNVNQNHQEKWKNLDHHLQLSKETAINLGGEPVLSTAPEEEVEVGGTLKQVENLLCTGVAAGEETKALKGAGQQGKKGKRPLG